VRAVDGRYIAGLDVGDGRSAVSTTCPDLPKAIKTADTLILDTHPAHDCGAQRCDEWTMVGEPEQARKPLTDKKNASGNAE
jgi:hypothetical protein